MFSADDLVHPFEAGPGSAVSGLVDGRRLDRLDRLDGLHAAATLRRACEFFGVSEPRVYVSRLPGHAHAHGAVRIAEQSLLELAPDELEALLAHLCGHLLLPDVAGELSADRAAALYQGSADAITRVIFAEGYGRGAQDREERAARTDRHGWIVHSGPSADDLAVRVREIQAWTATPSFTRLTARAQLA